jgi:hypothetical protein
MKIFTKEAMLEILDKHIFDNYKNASDYASFYEVSSQFVSAVRKGKKKPTKAMLDDLGFEQHTVKDVIYIKE